jgi:hypothetical protein
MNQRVYLQGDQNVSVYQMITIQKLQVIFKVSPASLQTFIDIRLNLTPPVIPNSHYVIMVSDWNGLKYFCVFLCRNHQVHKLCDHPAQRNIEAPSRNHFFSLESDNYYTFWVYIYSFVDPTSNASALYCIAARGLSGHTIFFPHCIINGTTFGKPHLNIKCVVWLSQQICQKHFLS